jgi:hypothetical protein
MCLCGWLGLKKKLRKKKFIRQVAPYRGGEREGGREIHGVRVSERERQTEGGRERERERE